MNYASPLGDSSRWTQEQLWAHEEHLRDLEIRIEQKTDELLKDAEWVWDTVNCHKELAELIGSVGLEPFSIDRAQALHERLRYEARTDAENFVKHRS